jgi:hypothetical protein
LAQDPNFTLTRQKWIADETGGKQLRSLPKKVRPWWRTDPTGAVVLTVVTVRNRSSLRRARRQSRSAKKKSSSPQSRLLSWLWRPGNLMR